ncbi:radical SAM protein [Christensenellaceae bacterium OttesenSCG-928-K19]|nr:radical SAM protein [Christensenellaceae bacterium OttesenSCG-928-K19]
MVDRLSASTFVYKLGNVNYINLTNKCTCACTFCIRDNGGGVGGYDLWLETEPSAQQVIHLLESDKTDIVFCGYGEPTMRLDALLEIARYVKGYGGHVRLDTNGHGSVYNGRDIAPVLAGKAENAPEQERGTEVLCTGKQGTRQSSGIMPIDEVSISLNAPTAEEYAKITNCRYGEQGFYDMLGFAAACVKNGIDTALSVVDVIGDKEIEACRKIAEDIGARLKVRHYVE